MESPNTDTIAKRQLQVVEASVYGGKVYRPANEAAQLVCDLTQKKTVTLADIATLKQYGFTIEVLAIAGKVL